MLVNVNNEIINFYKYKYVIIVFFVGVTTLYTYVRTLRSYYGGVITILEM